MFLLRFAFPQESLPKLYISHIGVIFFIVFMASIIARFVPCILYQKCSAVDAHFNDYIILYCVIKALEVYVLRIFSLPVPMLTFSVTYTCSVFQIVANNLKKCVTAFE